MGVEAIQYLLIPPFGSSTSHSVSSLRGESAHCHLLQNWFMESFDRHPPAYIVTEYLVFPILFRSLNSSFRLLWFAASAAAPCGNAVSWRQASTTQHLSGYQQRGEKPRRPRRQQHRHPRTGCFVLGVYPNVTRITKLQRLTTYSYPTTHPSIHPFSHSNLRSLRSLRNAPPDSQRRARIIGGLSLVTISPFSYYLLLYHLSPFPNLSRAFHWVAGKTRNFQFLHLIFLPPFPW